MYATYHYLRPVAIFAGVIGLIQSLGWISLAIVALVAYNCGFDFSTVVANAESLRSLVFFRQYFLGQCDPGPFPTVDLSVVDALNLLGSSAIHAFAWVYLFISFCWLISSILLITNVKTTYLKYANYFLYPWILIAFALCILDLALGILFGIDYNTITVQASITGLNPLGMNAIVLSYARSIAGIMMTVTFRGYVIWALNLSLLIYFFVQTFKLYEYNRSSETTGTLNKGYVPETHSMHNRHPIDAYAFHNRKVWNDPIHHRQRARSFSGRDSPFVDERRQQQFHQQQQQHHHQQPPSQQFRQDPSRDNNVVIRRDHANSIARELNQINNTHPGTGRIMYANESQIPVPDYSPPPQRAHFDNRPQLRSALRSSRY